MSETTSMWSDSDSWLLVFALIKMSKPLTALGSVVETREADQYLHSMKRPIALS